MRLVPWESSDRVFLLPVLLPVRSRFCSRFAPGFAPDSRSNSIALNHSVGSRKRWLDRGIGSLSHAIIIHHTPLRWFF